MSMLSSLYYNTLCDKTSVNACGSHIVDMSIVCSSILAVVNKTTYGTYVKVKHHGYSRLGDQFCDLQVYIYWHD